VCSSDLTTRTLYRVLVVFIPFVLWILPANFFDEGPSICISKLITEVDCPGCGITRATQHAWHFDFQTAWNYNKMIVVVGPLLLWLYLQELRESYLYFFHPQNDKD
jgi:hypothetical protein